MFLVMGVARADEPATLKNFNAPSKNSKDEPPAATVEIAARGGAPFAPAATGVAPEVFEKPAAAPKGLAGLGVSPRATPPQNLHHKAMTLWAVSYVEDFWTDDGKKAAVKELLAA